MTTPIILLALLCTPYLIARAVSSITGRPFHGSRYGAAGLGLLFAFTALGHFVQTAAMAEMLPPWVPGRALLVVATGVLELAIAGALFVPRLREKAGWAAAALLVLFLPVNVWAAFHHVPMGGHAWGPAYLLVRIPLQVVILLWTVRFAARRPRRERRPAIPKAA